MKKTLVTTAIASSLLFAGQTVQAEESAYIGLQYNMYTVGIDGLDDLEPDGLVVKLGGDISEHFQLETRFGRSLSDDNVDGAALKVDEYIGFYVKGGMEFADMVFPYVALGYTKVDFEFHGSQNDLTESDLSYGIGADVRIGQFQVGLEWIMLQDKSDYDLENLNVSAAWRF